MPIYEYLCQKCERLTEVIQRVGERPIRRCPHCGGRVRKIASAPAIQFKGSGFYITDYAKSATGGGEKEASGSEKSEKAEKTDKAGGAEKPAAKSEKKKETKDKKAAKD